MLQGAVPSGNHFRAVVDTKEISLAIWTIFITFTWVPYANMDIDIQGIAYSQLAYPLDNSDQWQNLMAGQEANDLDLFKQYIQEIVIKGDISDVTVGRFDGSDVDPHDWIETIRTADVQAEEQEFLEAAKNVSEKLNDMIHQAANEGVLFSVQAVIEDDGGGNIVEDGPHRVATILKLDLEEEERLQLKSDNSLEELDLDDIFPEPNELQKGLCYPIIKVQDFRLPGDVKFYQKDNVSGYFQEFLECSSDPGSLDQAKKVFDAVSEIKRERTGELADGNDLTRFKDLQESTDGDVVGIDHITSVASDIVGSDVSSDDIAEKMGVDDPQSIAIDSTELPNKVKYTVDDEIDVTFPSSASEHVQRRTTDDGVEVTITGSDVDTNVLDR